MEKFDKLLSEAIGDTMRLVFGESASELIYTLMEKYTPIKRQDIEDKIEVFYSFLERLLGSELTQIIQTTGLKRLCLKLRREYEEVEKYFLFLDGLYEVKFQLLHSSFRERDSLVCN